MTTILAASHPSRPGAEEGGEVQIVAGEDDIRGFAAKGGRVTCEFYRTHAHTVLPSVGRAGKQRDVVMAVARETVEERRV